jgi:hypothetical protein
MSILPIRGVGEIGIVPDLASYDLPLNAWASGRNVRFKNKTITRSPVFKNITHAFPMASTPTIVVDTAESPNVGCITTILTDGTIKQLYNGVVSVVSPVVPMEVLTTRPTAARLGGVTYLNSLTNVPLFRASPDDGAFSPIPGWGASDRCVALRSYKDYLVALNVTKGTNQYENMIKWSDASMVGAPPANWDTASLSSHAGENVLSDATGYLIDGFTLGNSFILYGSHETYSMSFIGTPLIFTFDKLFSDLGVFTTDCVVEVDGKHYVFGRNGIYLHDGMSKITISDGKVTDYIYGRIDSTKEKRCFVVHNRTRSEITFCYPSIQAAWAISDTQGCNEGAVFNYAEGTWSFVDLPGVVSVTLTSMPTSPTWESLGTWESMSSTWAALGGTAPQITLMMSAGNTALGISPKVHFYDELFVGLISNSPDPDLDWAAWITTSLKDSDEMGSGLGTRKVIRSLLPQAVTQPSQGSIKVSTGTAESPNGSMSWTDPMQFNPATQYKCDFRTQGRYLGIKFEFPQQTNAVLSGYDVDIELIAQR